MNKIKYPTDPVEKTAVETEFYNSLSNTYQSAIDRHLKKITFKGSSLSFKRLVTLPFDDLITLAPTLRQYCVSKQNKNSARLKGTKFERLFDYKANQPNIAKYFMHQKYMQFKTCSYCSIDFINSFIDFPDFKNPIDFVNRADIYELQFIDGVDKKLAESIIKGRGSKGYSDLNSLKIYPSIFNNVKKVPFEDSHNHFTLDHIIPQNSHRFFSLCLYNLVPSCYSCNSKFKGKKTFNISPDLVYLSPTSQDCSINENFNFTVYFEGELRDISNVNDFSLHSNIVTYHTETAKFLRIFKILGRYIYHKDKALSLIEKKKEYPDSKIKELSRQMGLPFAEIQRMIFGDDLFLEKFDGGPLIKFRRDIARNIYIANVRP